MPRNRHQGHVDEALQRRTGLAIQLAQDWMSAMNMSQRGLSRRLNVDQSVLSRFLSQQPGYEPAPKRPRILKLLEDIEQFCTQIEDVSLWHEDGIFDSSDALKVWWRAHTHRLRKLRQDPDPAKALVYVSELAGQALYFPLPYRPHACVNTELAVSLALFHEYSSHSCSDALIRRSLGLVDQLKEAALHSIPELELGSQDKDEHLARATNYASSSYGYGGLRLADEAFVEAAVGGLIESTRYWSRPVTRVWHNALHFVELLLERSHPKATTWCLELVDGVDCQTESLRVALTDHELSHVTSLLANQAPAVLRGK